MNKYCRYHRKKNEAHDKWKALGISLYLGVIMTVLYLITPSYIKAAEEYGTLEQSADYLSVAEDEAKAYEIFSDSIEERLDSFDEADDSGEDFYEYTEDDYESNEDAADLNDTFSERDESISDQLMADEADAQDTEGNGESDEFFGDQTHCEHIHTKILEKVEATGSTKGLTEGLVCADCNEVLLEQTDIEKIRTTKPLLDKLELTENGIKISWDECENAEMYRVFRKKEGASKWAKVATVTNTVTYDKTAASGETYFYTVRCVAFDETTYMSGYDEAGLKIRYIECPKISSLGNKKDGILIQWSKCAGASKYCIYRKNEEGKWIAQGSTTATQFTDTKIPAGETGVYTVRCKDSKGQNISAYEKQGQQIIRLKECSIDTLKNKNGAVEFTWSMQTGAQGYKIYRKKSGDSQYTYLGKVSDTTLIYRDSDVKNGYNYYYAVRSYSGNVNSSAKSSIWYYLTAPAFTSLTNTIDNTVTASWGPNTKVSGYQIQYKTGENSCRSKFQGSDRIRNNINYLEKDKTYTFHVRSYLTASGKTYYSAWSAGKNITIKKGKLFDFTKLKMTINNIINSRGGRWSVYVKELGTGQVLSINDSAMYPASVIKLFVMASTFDQIQKGKIKRNSYINSLLTEMITVSDNEAYNELVRYHSGSHSFISGAAVVRNYLTANGYTATECHHTLSPSSSAYSGDGIQNCSSARDAGMILERIYRGECVSGAYSKEMLNLLKRQTRTWKIPSAIPSGVVVANKTGETTSYQHDTAIVYGPKSTFIICVFSNTSEYNGNAGIRQIASAVYKFLN